MYWCTLHKRNQRRRAWLAPIGLAVPCALLSIAPVCAQSAGAPAFDVASVKVVDLAARPVFGITGGPGTSDPGRIHFARAAMIELLMRAFGVENDQISGPAWIQDFSGPNLYVVDATMPPETQKEQFQLMMQKLLAERFHLAVHHDTRNFPGYDLVVAKGGPMLKETVANPAAGAANVPLRPPGIGKDGFPIGKGMSVSAGTSRLRAEAESMAEFAGRLGGMLSEALGDNPGGPSRRPRVVDKTGLIGKYDFTFEYSCAGCRGLGSIAATLPLLAGRLQADAQPAAGASEPAGSGLPTIFAALEKQLGLRLEKVRDVPVDVVVVDRVDKVPTEN